MATKSPVCFQAVPSIVTGPLIGGSADAGLITCGRRAVRRDLDAETSGRGVVALDRPAQRTLAAVVRCG